MRRRRDALVRMVTASCLVISFAGALSVPAQAAPVTTVTLDFDGNTISQYNLGYLQALKPHAVAATFFVNSGTVGASANFMTWTQLTEVSGAGNDIGGKTVNATNLTTDPNPSTQVCNDRTALLQHGFTPVAFAYPGGATNATVKTIVKNCGYGNGRTAGSLSPNGPTYAETVPPADWFGIRAYAPSAVTLANMESLVRGAASHNGGWTQIVIGKVCSQALDPSNYSTCSSGSGHIELADLNAFLDWVAGAGQPSGAPAGTVLGTARSVLAGADSLVPASTITCNGAPCTTDPYPGVVSVALSATDTGSGVASIRYTTDGSDPSASSATYTGPFNVNGSTTSTTVKYRAFDYAGNAEPTQSQTVQAPPDTAAPSTSISCNSAPCTSTAYVASVTVALTASDTGGSGVSATYYTTDGSTPTTASSVYSGPFVLSTPATYTVRFFSVDNAGNAEAPQAQQVQVVPVRTSVSLTFDNGAISQYTLGYLQALQPHGAHATFFVNSGTVGVVSNIMTWSQLATLDANGQDVGGKTVNATNLTTDADPTSQVCDDRAALRAHGLSPAAFAYPGGAFNASVKSVVQSCGYGNARSAGSLSPSGPTYAETIPPKDWLATRAYAPNGQVTLSAMQSLVTGAAAHNGGWTQIVIGRVCSQAQDPNNYTACTSSSGWVELADLNTFLDWMQAAGQSGGAPAGAALSTVRDVAESADTSAPTTTILCNDAACSNSAYTQTVTVTLSATDVGSSVAATRYTTDGSDPDSTSPLYTGALRLTSTTTIKFRSWDYAGNAEATHTQLIQATLPPDTTPPTTTIACNGAPCTTPGYEGHVDVSLAATDTGGWGVDKTYYTTDGTAPSTSSAQYSGPFTLHVPGTYHVQFFSTDLAGNVEPTESQDVIVLPPKIIVSLTFDDGSQAQYDRAFLRALQPHHMVGTFYDVSGANDVDPEHMTWAELTAVNNAGDEIGGHTVDHVDLTSVDTATATTEVCRDRQNLLDHGFYPTSFAYPTGAYNTSVENIVKNCGYATARRAGGIDVAGDGAGPVYAETLPPADPYATRTVYKAPVGNPATVPPMTLAQMQAAVTAAGDNGGGWVTFVFHLICSQSLDPSHYNDCISSWAPIELDTLNAFLDWLQQSGQPGGAPPKTSVQTVAQATLGADTQAPVTTITCDGSPCQQSGYTNSTSVALHATDPGGSGVRATYYTTDGSTPTTSSPTYSGPFTITSTTTVNFFSVDNSGNVEPAQSVQIVVTTPPPPDTTPPTSTIQCNAAACQSSAYPGPVSVALSAVDNPGGSGVASIRYTTDGTDPSMSSPAYSAPFTVSATTTVKYRAWDLAGNVEATNSQVVQVAVDSPPAARLSVTPSSGVAPLPVTADASASTDTDATGITSYTFVFGDGTAAVTQSAPTALHSYATSGTFTVTVTVRDSANLSSSAQQTVTVASNAFKNSGFEQNLTGWAASGSGATLTRVSGGHSGNWSVRVDDNGKKATTCVLDDSPNAVSSTSSGTYHASLWVKGASGGATLTLLLRELSGKTVKGSASATVVLTTSWQLVTLTYQPKSTGSTLDFNASVAQVAAGATAFYADDAALWVG